MAEWRQGKTAVECNHHMLENEIGCDVSFTVGPDDDATEIVRAHKNILMARSSVFEAMFNGELPERKETIRVVDLEPRAFRDILL